MEGMKPMEKLLGNKLPVTLNNGASGRATRRKSSMKNTKTSNKIKRKATFFR